MRDAIPAYRFEGDNGVEVDDEYVARPFARAKDRHQAVDVLRRVQTKWMLLVSLNAWANSFSRSASVGNPSLVPVRPMVAPSISRTSMFGGGRSIVRSKRTALRPWPRKSPDVEDALAVGLDE